MSNGIIGLQVAEAHPDDPWALYLHGDSAFLAFRGKLRATATCHTTDDLARLLACRDRLNAREKSGH